VLTRLADRPDRRHSPEQQSPDPNLSDALEGLDDSDNLPDSSDRTVKPSAEQRQNGATGEEEEEEIDAMGRQFHDLSSNSQEIASEHGPQTPQHGGENGRHESERPEIIDEDHSPNIDIPRRRGKSLCRLKKPYLTQ